MMNLPAAITCKIMRKNKVFSSCESSCGPEILGVVQVCFSPLEKKSWEKAYATTTPLFLLFCLFSFFAKKIQEKTMSGGVNFFLFPDRQIKRLDENLERSLQQSGDLETSIVNVILDLLENLDLVLCLSLLACCNSLKK